MTPDVEGGLEGLAGQVRALPSERATAVEPVPVSPLRDGIPSATILKLSGDRYSPNLRRFLAKQQRPWRGFQRVYRDLEGIAYLGWIDDTHYFIGCKLMRVLGVGGRAEVYAYPNKAAELTEDAGFWDRYIAIGRCAIDPAHNGWWSGEETRWQVEGGIRHCLWCGNHTQHLRRWTETKVRERWGPVPEVQP